MKFGVRDVLSIEGHLFLINFLKSRTFHREKTLYIMEGGFRSMDLEEQYEKIYRYCYFRLRHQQMAEDITQETFLRFLESGNYCER